MQVHTRQALICWIGAYGIIVAALYLILGAPTSSQGAGEALGRAFAHTGFATLGVWLFARKKAPPWSWPKFVAVYVLALVALGVIANAGRVHAADDSLPFSVEFPDGWHVESLRGVSSAASDQSLGVRERARWQGADGIAVVELMCSWLLPNDKPDPAEQLNQVIRSIESLLTHQGYDVELGKTTAGKIGRQHAVVTDLIASGTKNTMQQKIAMTTTSRCLFTATLSGTPAAFKRQSSAFVSILEHVRFDQTR